MKHTWHRCMDFYTCVNYVICVYGSLKFKRHVSSEVKYDHLLNCTKNFYRSFWADNNVSIDNET